MSLKFHRNLGSTSHVSGVILRTRDTLGSQSMLLYTFFQAKSCLLKWLLICTNKFILELTTKLFLIVFCSLKLNFKLMCFPDISSDPFPITTAI